MSTLSAESSYDEEIWKDFPDDMQLSRYQASNLGRIKNKNTDYIFNPKPTCIDYIRANFVLDTDKKKRILFSCIDC